MMLELAQVALITVGYASTCHVVIEHVLPAIERARFNSVPLVIEREKTSKQHFPNTQEGILHCVICSRCFPPPFPGDKQTDRTYCYETVQNRSRL